MIEHPVPRQITTFEFKLIGELTVKQFGYLLFGSIAAIVVYFLVPSFAFLNFVAAAIPALIGIAFAFVPINERPLETWLKNFITRLISPTQYFFKKHNRPPKILMGVTLPPRDLSKQHLLAKQKLEEYMQNKQKTAAEQSAIVAADTVTSQKQNDLKKLIFEVNSKAPNHKSDIFPNKATFDVAGKHLVKRVWRDTFYVLRYTLLVLWPFRQPRRLLERWSIKSARWQPRRLRGR